MKTTKSKFTIVLAGLILLGSAMAPSQVAVAQFANLDPFQVLKDRTSVPDEHNNAVYMVFQSTPPPNPEYAIFFIQTQGKYSFKPFVCADGERDPGSQSISCSLVSQLSDHSLQLRETVAVGRLVGSFCNDLKPRYNPSTEPEKPVPIMEESDCHAPGRCSCYEVVHECREDESDPWDVDKCPPPPDLERIRADERGMVPPSRGAGSGAN